MVLSGKSNNKNGKPGLQGPSKDPMKIMEAREYKTRQTKAEAIQFTGDNDNYSYIQAFTKKKVWRDQPDVVKLRPDGMTTYEGKIGDWIVLQDGQFSVIDDVHFQRHFQLTDSESARDGDMHSQPSGEGSDV